MKLPRGRLFRWPLYLIGLLLVILASIVVVFAIQARMRYPALKAWHRIALKEEFTEGRVASFDEYKQLEERLFAEVRRRVIDDPDAADSNPLGRYTKDSVPGKIALDTVYNHSFELAPSDPRCSVLLVHGLSDSPYSFRAMGEIFFAQGCYVLALRMPGHGTIPSALRDVAWEDWYAAVVLAAKHAAAQAGPGEPFMAGGHSTGAALVTLYSLRALEDSSLPRPQRLYLVSPAIGISPFAALTNFVSVLSVFPPFETSDWIDVLPEYDPYKYNSFPVNAANQIHKLTRVVSLTIHSAYEEGTLDGMPKVTVFQSLVDSTVTAAEVVHGLLSLLPADGHRLIVFDVNRRERLEGFLAPGPLESLDRLSNSADLPFALTIVGNRLDGTPSVAAYSRPARSLAFSEEDLPLEWPGGVFSVGHVSLPFPPDDPVYGLTRPADGGFNLGAVAARGESGALVVSLGTFARLRSNPFFDVIRQTIVRDISE